MRARIVFSLLVGWMIFSAPPVHGQHKKPKQGSKPPLTQPQPSQPVNPSPQTQPALIESGPDLYPRQCPPAGRKVSVAVYPIKAVGAVDKSVAATLTSLVNYELAQSGKLIVIKEDMLKVVMERQALNVSDACDSTLCQVEIGKLVQAQKMVSSEMSKLGSLTILTVNLIDIQTGALEFSGKEQCACTEEQLQTLAGVAAAKVKNHFCDQVPVPALSQGQASPARPSAGVGPSPDKAMVKIYATASYSVIAELNLPVVVDGEIIGGINPFGCIKKELEPGDHVLKSIRSGNLSFQTIAGETYYVVITLAMFGRFGYSLISEAEAASWSQNCQAVP